MKQKVPVSFVLVLTICLIVLLFFYFQSIVERHQYRAFMEMQDDILQLYSDKMQNKDFDAKLLDSLKSKYNQNDYFLKHWKVLEQPYKEDPEF